MPTIFWQPGRVEAGRVVRAVASTTDLLPTAFAMAGQPLPTERVIDGRDLNAVLRGASVERDPLFFYGPRELHAVRSGPWKLHIRTSSQTGIQHFDGKLPLLFHLDHDPSEEWDLAEKHPEIVAELQSLIELHLAEVAATGTDFDE